MFCPRCHCEFRSGYTRCVACDVDLVEDPSALEPEQVDAPEAPIVATQMAEVCGFLDLTEARRARNSLHEKKIASELVIRTSPETPPHGDVLEEYWLRADAQQIRNVQALLEGKTPAATEPAAAEKSEAATFKCSKCGLPVREEESFCAGCGTRFGQ